MNTKLSRRPCPARACAFTHSRARIVRHRAPRRARARRPTSSAVTRARDSRRRSHDARVDLPNLAKTSKSRETPERIYPKLTVDDRFDARERRAIRAMREDASMRRATAGTTATASAARHRDGERGANDG
jgi:hypothetical protein